MESFNVEIDIFLGRVQTCHLDLAVPFKLCNNQTGETC